MARVNPYLLFDGTCEAAFLFYKSVFGSEIPYMGRFNEMPTDEDNPVSDEMGNRIMHVFLPISNETILYGSDTNQEKGKYIEGNNISISINASSEAEAEKLFNGLSEGGTITMPLEKTFWNAYFGMFTDKFGIHWMVNYDFPMVK